MLPHILSSFFSEGMLDQEWFSSHVDRLLHLSTPAIVEGRDVIAGQVRGSILSYQKFVHLVEEDPIYQESYQLAHTYSIVSDLCLKNIFLIMKYGMQGLSGDIVEFGSYRGGSALFMAHVARRLHLPLTVYALDTFQGMPATHPMLDSHEAGDFQDAALDHFHQAIQEYGLTNVIPIPGLFEETLPKLLPKIPSVALAHIDCDIYSSTHYALSSIQSYMNAAGGYLVFDDVLYSSCLGAYQALEELLQSKGYRAEQAYPHFVYRLPKLKN